MNVFLAGKLRFLEHCVSRYQEKIHDELNKVLASSTNLRGKIRDDEEFVKQDIQDVMDEFNEVFLDLNHAVKRMNEQAELAKMVYDHHLEYFEDDLKVFYDATDAPVYMDGMNETTAEELR